MGLYTQNKGSSLEHFVEWKSLVEKATKKKVVTLRTDNGGESTSTQFEEYLRAESILYKLTIPKTPQKNGVAEHLNRTLVEMTRSMLLDAKLPGFVACESQKILGSSYRGFTDLSAYI